MDVLVWIAFAVQASSGCTLISGVNDFEIVDGGGDSGDGGETSGDGGQDAGDGEVDAGDGEVDVEVRATDAVISMSGLSVHATQWLGFSVVDGLERLTARGWVRLPVASSSPVIQIALEGALVGEAPFQLHFFADRNGNLQADPQPEDHTWVREFDANGEIEFAHAFLFEDLPEARPFGADVVLRFADGSEDPRDALNLQDKVYELRVSLPGGQDVGLMQLHPDENTPLPEVITLEGIVDSGNTYTITISADGVPVDGDELELTAPTIGDLEVELTRELFGL